VSYLLDISPSAQSEIKRLPGNIRQRIVRAIKMLAEDPRPATSKQLDYILGAAEPRRLRLEHWRIIYAVVDLDINRVAVVSVRRRPPYQYGDLSKLFSEFQ
jgi:mRNA-degrading endonuclease RelE of RelBE toxin-antitoxin system